MRYLGGIQEVELMASVGHIGYAGGGGKVKKQKTMHSVCHEK